MFSFLSACYHSLHNNKQYLIKNNKHYTDNTLPQGKLKVEQNERIVK